MQGISISRRDYGASARFEPHAHDQTQITLVLSGSIKEYVDDTLLDAGPLDVLVKPAGLIHSDRFGDWGARTLQISICPRSPQHTEFSFDGIGRWQRRNCEPLARSFLRLLCPVRESTRDDALQIRIACVLRALNETPLPEDRSTPEWLGQVDRDICQYAHSSNRVCDVARQYAVHPGSLNRSYRRTFGLTITQRIKQLRVQRAAFLLTETDKPAALISGECGFADQSHMNRVFKDFTGLTPRQFRTSVTASSANPHPRPDAGILKR